MLQNWLNEVKEWLTAENISRLALLGAVLEFLRRKGLGATSTLVGYRPENPPPPGRAAPEVPAEEINRLGSTDMIGFEAYTERDNEGERTWAELFTYVFNAEAPELYGLLIAGVAVPFLIVAFTRRVLRGESGSWTIMLLIAGVALTPLVGHLHRRQPFHAMHILLISIATMSMTGYTIQSMHTIVNDLSKVDGATQVYTTMALGFPGGIGWLAVILWVAVARQESCKGTRWWAIPAWLAITVGAIGTFALTHRPGNMIIAVFSVGATIACLRFRRNPDKPIGTTSSATDHAPAAPNDDE